MTRPAVLAFALAALTWQGTASSVTAEADLIVGVRTDAPPFSYLAVRDREGRLTSDTPPLASGEVFTGYMANICATVLEELQKSRDFTVEWKAIEARDRFTDLQSGKINILCDPATITQERLSYPGVLVSPPVYLSGVGRAETTRDQWAGHWPCIGPVAGIVEGTTAPRSIRLIAEKYGFGETFSEIVRMHPDVDKVVLSDDEKKRLTDCPDAVAGLTWDVGSLAKYVSADAADTDPDAAYVVRSYPNHEKLAQALCDGQIYYSVGDLEIVTLALKSYIERNPDCQARADAQVYSEERYGIFVHLSDQMNSSDQLALAFLRQLTIEIHKGHDSILVRSFSDNFDRNKISRSLDLFLWNLVAGAN